MKKWLLFFILPLYLFADLKCEHDEKGRLKVLDLEKFGSVCYFYDAAHLLQVSRVAPSGEIIYTHSYCYNAEGNLISESLINDLGEMIYESLEDELSILTTTPYSVEICEYNENYQLIRRTQDESVNEYAYNNLNELITENIPLDCTYDINGNLIKKKTPQGESFFIYDDQNHLVRVVSKGFDAVYDYDEKGRRSSKTVYQGNQKTKETYRYHGINDIIILDGNGNLKELRIPGLSFHQDLIKPIAIETPTAIYAPIHNAECHIVKLINVLTKEEIVPPAIDPFGKGLSASVPTSWIFSGKHFDSETGLVYFGYRYYDPEMQKWISPDPFGILQSSDLYQYCLNNPLRYIDPDGRWGFVIPLTLELGELAAALTAAAAAVTLGWSVEKANQWYKDKDERERREEFERQREAMQRQREREKKAFEQQVVGQSDGIGSMEREAGCNFPDRSLPRHPRTDEPLPDVDVPHTQLGTRTSKKTGEEYPQAREFDENGRPVRDIDFTDHGYPGRHDNPHQHEYEDNKNGGTRKRGDAKPLDEAGNS